MNIEYTTLLEIVTAFYEKATKDILIGYHFRVIEDFSTHLPRIAYFWQLQLTGKIDQKSELPFKIIPLHKALRVNKGEVYRWEVLFSATLDDFIKENKISNEDKINWMKKIEIFKQKILNL